MANTIILKKSSTASAIPAAGSLQPGELAVNLADAKLYTKTTGGTVILVGSGASGGGSGTVTSVAASGGTTGLTFTGSPITTSGTLTLGGTLAVANGGTGATTAAGALTNLGAYPATNPSGYTSNTGTVTGVTGTAPIVSSGGTAPAISISAATTSAAGSMSSADKTKLDGIAANANNYVLPKATATALGGVEVFDATVQTVAANAVTATASRTYGVQLNAADQMVVNVPWVDTNSGGTVTGVTGTAPIVSSGGNAPAISISAATTSAAGSMSAADKTKLDGIAASANNYVLPKATATALGGVEVFDATVQTVAANAVTSTASRTYGVQLNAADQMVVNVPWTDANSGGTVTSVAGTGTVSGLTLSGTVTTSGSLTLGGTLSLTSGNVTTALGYTPYNATNPSGYITSSGSISGNAATATNATAATRLSFNDIRTISPSSAAVTTLSFGFTSWANNNSAPYADFLHFRGYADSSGGNENLLMLRKDTLGVRVYQQTFGSATAYSTFKDVAWTDGTNASGTWGINVTGNAATATTLQTARTINGVSFNGSANITVADSTKLPLAGGTMTGAIAFAAGQTWPTFNQSTTGNATTATTATTANALNTSNNYQVNSLGVGTAGSGTAGEIRATNNVTAYYSSDARLKENVRPIENALGIVSAVGGKTFDWTDAYIAEHGGEDGYFVQKSDFGVIAQDVEAMFPLAVRTRDDGTLAVDYEKLVAVAFAAIKELKAELDELRGAK
jgi:hypothetical protein